MRRLKFLSVFVSLALVFSVSPGAVMAKEPPPNWTDPELVGDLVKKLAAAEDASSLWAELPLEAQTAVVKYLSPARFVPYVLPGLPGESVSTSGNAQPMSSGCREYTLGGDMYSHAGIWLWRYAQKIWWCYNGTRVTAQIRDRWGEVHAYGWEFVGHIGNNESGGTGQSYYYAWTQGHFRLCLTGNIGCVAQQYPWIWQKVYGTGGAEGNVGG